MRQARQRAFECRQCSAAGHGGGHGTPFAAPGSPAMYAPDRVCDIRHIRLEIALDFEQRAVQGVCTLTAVPFDDGQTRLTLNAVEMTVSSVVLADGSAVPFGYDGKHLTVDLGQRQGGEEVILAVHYRTTPRRGLYFIHPDTAHPDRPVQAWTQGQDEDNRHWFPCIDHPHQKSTTEVIATVPGGMTVLSNGRLVDERHDGRRSVWHYRHDVPHSSYLVTLVAGAFQTIRDRSSEVELLYFVPAGREADAARTFGRTPEILRLFAALTGEPYPYPRYSQITVAEFIFGGMENTSATTLTDQILHDERAHLDFSAEMLVAHELAHQWFGNLVTCRDWSQGWLNEGFATYFELLWQEHGHGRDEADYERMHAQDVYFDEVRQRYSRPIVTQVYQETTDLFDRHLYQKGACVLHLLRTTLGDERFWKAVRHYLARHKGRSVETRDLVRAIEDATGYNADRFFDQWVFSPGHPAFEVDYRWDPERSTAVLQVKQTQTPLFTVPVRIRFVVDGREQDLTITPSAALETFVLPLSHEPTQVVFDAGDNVLKTLTTRKGDGLWHAQLRAASLGIDRVRAAQALGEAADPAAIPVLDAAMTSDPFWAVRGEAAAALGEIRTDAARDALLARLPAEREPRARRMVVRALGSFRHDERAAEALLGVLAGDPSYFVEGESALALARTRSPHAFAVLAEAMGRPSCTNVIQSMCLGGMAELREERGIDLALLAARDGGLPSGRRAAMAAMAVLGGEHPSRKRQIRETLVEHLDDADFRGRLAAVEALGLLGDRAAIPALHRAASRDLDGRMRRRARDVASVLEREAPQDEALRSVRDQLEKLTADHRQLKERLTRLEPVPDATGRTP